MRERLGSYLRLRRLSVLPLVALLDDLHGERDRT